MLRRESGVILPRRRRVRVCRSGGEAALGDRRSRTGPPGRPQADPGCRGGSRASRRICLPSGVGGIETEAVMLGLPVSLTLPEVVGCELTGSSNSFVTSIDVVLGITKVRSGCASHTTQCMRLYMNRGPLRAPVAMLADPRRAPTPDSAVRPCSRGAPAPYSSSRARGRRCHGRPTPPLSSEEQTQQG